MTLTQRLTRAGATFIVFGVVAAILPQQNEAAMADNGCTVTNHTFAIKNSGGTISTAYTIAKNSSDTYKSFYDTTNEGVITVTNTSADATISGSGTSSVSVVTPNTDGSISLSASDANRGAQYIATATISY